MPDSVLAEIRALTKLSVSELHARYTEVFGEESRSRNKDYLWKRIAWRIQEIAEGGLSERIKDKARAIARDEDLRVVPLPEKRGIPVAQAQAASNMRVSDDRVPSAGATLTREFKGRVYSVNVLPNGFEYDGQQFKSLSAVARLITGTRWNGLAFFGLPAAKEKA